ncbi:MAG: glycosyltransferase family 4 protein [Deltaproteobacteria bacterium]
MNEREAMKEIVLVDVYYSHGGHNKVYADTIMTGIDSFEACLAQTSKEIPILHKRTDIIKIIIYNIKYLLKIFFNRNKHIHFLFLDSFIKYIWLMYPLLVILKKSRGLTITGTYHVFNKNKFMNPIMGLFDAIVVHSDFEPKDLKKKSKIIKINYPSFLSIKADKRCHPERIRFGFLGGNRKEKRFDLFIEAINKTQHDIEVVIGGANTDLSSNGLQLNKKSKIISRFLTDEELKELIQYIDVLILPYDSSFKGQSGPLIEAAYAGKIIISSDAQVMKQTVIRYNLGEIFESGNSKDLVEKIDKVILNFDSYYPNKEFWKDYDKSKFIADYADFFKQYQT